MAWRRFDYRCPQCTHKWEELVVVSSTGQAAAPRCPACRRAFGTKLFGAPSIRTADNAPRDLRTLNTAGHPVAGATVHGKRVWDSQLGKSTEGMSGREIEKYAKARGLEIVPQRVYGDKYLSYEPPPPRLEDDPQLVRETEELAADMYDRAEAGALPPIETPLLDQDREARETLEATVDLVSASEGA